MNRDFLPYYMMYPFPFWEDRDAHITRDLEYLQQMYPKKAKQYQKLVYETLNLLDYEGSVIYDEYPDKYMFYHLCSKIKESMKPEIKAQAEQSCFLDELVHVLLGQEICRRRCRRTRCRATFYHW